MNTTPILYILHEHGELSHFYAADLCTRRHGYAVCYREFNYRTQVKSIAVAWNKGKLRHVVANMLFPMQLLFGKRRKVVIGIAPFNRWLPVWSWILRRHEAYYFTSYTCWNGTKAVYNAHPSDTLIRIWRNFIGNRAKAVFAVSSKTKEELVRNGFVTEEKVIVVHHSHKEPPAPAEAVCKRNRFIYVGRMVPEKGIGELLDIFGRRPEALFTVVGSGSEAAEVSCKSEICANIVYAGYIADRVYLSELYREHCFLVLNSHRTAGWEELFGIAIIEAMSNGVVPLATDHTGPCEIITNEENGLLCPEGEIEVLIDRAMRMDEAKYRLLRHNAIRTAQEYRCEQVAARWNRLFED